MDDQHYERRLLKWCELKQTEVHEGPYPPASQCDDLLIRLKLTVQDGVFEMETNQPQSLVCRFAPNSMLIGEKNVWISSSSEEKRLRSVGDLVYALFRLGHEVKGRTDLGLEIFKRVESTAVLLPQLAIDVHIRLIAAVLYGNFEGYDDKELCSRIKEAWAMFRDANSTSDDNDMPPSCSVCLENFGGGVDDELISRLPCSHYYHAHCVIRWVKFRQTCPLCRRQIMPLLREGNEPFKPNPDGWHFIP